MKKQSLQLFGLIESSAILYGVRLGRVYTINDWREHMPVRLLKSQSGSYLEFVLLIHHGLHSLRLDATLEDAFGEVPVRVCVCVCVRVCVCVCVFVFVCV